MTADLGELTASPGQRCRRTRKGQSQGAGAGRYAAVVIDARERFVNNYVLPALAANAMYEGVYPLSAALSRPLIGALLVEVAHQ